jgi:transcriptional regulator with XRE-family HTH domain
LTKPTSPVTLFTDLGLAEELEDREFRNQFFRTERELDIPAQIKALRKFRKMNQEELAVRAGTQQSAISRIERSQEANWELETLVKLAEALDAKLSVVIEPYEQVIAKYKAERQTVRVSAATATHSEGQHPNRDNLVESTRAPTQQERPSNKIGNGSQTHAASQH